MKKVEEYYDFQYDEWDRLERHKLEFDITKRHLDNTITKQHSKILDCGGGPGRYSMYLSQKGHEVTLLDLSNRNIEVAKEKARELGVGIKRFIHGNALTLELYQLEKYDYILLMGPLYHITDILLQKKVLKDLAQNLVPGGTIIASFISAYAPIIDYLKGFTPLENESANLLNYLGNGVNDEEGGFTTAYFTTPEEAKELLEDCGYIENGFYAVECLLGIKESELSQLSGDEYKKWLDICFKLGSDENLLGTSEHFLYIGSHK